MPSRTKNTGSSSGSVRGTATARKRATKARRAAAPKPKPKAKPPENAREKRRRPEATSRLTAAIGGGPIVLDAALGTRLCAMGLDLKTDDPALWNLTHPDAVKELHRRDVAAGSQAIVTNTFGANRAWLARFNRANEVAAINRRAVELARNPRVSACS